MGYTINCIYTQKPSRICGLCLGMSNLANVYRGTTWHWDPVLNRFLCVFSIFWRCPCLTLYGKHGTTQQHKSIPFNLVNSTWNHHFSWLFQPQSFEHLTIAEAQASPCPWMSQKSDTSGRLSNSSAGGKLNRQNIWQRNFDVNSKYTLMKIHTNTIGIHIYICYIDKGCWILLCWWTYTLLIHSEIQ